MAPDDRTAELADNLARTRLRVEQACAAAGRPADAVTLIVVTKFFGAEDVRRLAGLGVEDVGENRAQEAAAKYEQCEDLDLIWHFIGQLQTNKAASVVGYADLIHTVDRSNLVKAIGKAAGAIGKRQDVLIQVNLDPQPRAGRGGAPAEQVPELSAMVLEHPSLRLRGVMGVAPLGEDPSPAFAELAAISANMRLQAPDADIVSAGMSADLETAIQYGATHLRIGAAVMGSRPTVR